MVLWYNGAVVVWSKEKCAHNSKKSANKKFRYSLVQQPSSLLGISGFDLFGLILRTIIAQDEIENAEVNWNKNEPLTLSVGATLFSARSLHNGHNVDTILTESNATAFLISLCLSEMLNKVTSTMVDGGGQGAGEQVGKLILGSSNPSNLVHQIASTLQKCTLNDGNSEIFCQEIFR